MTTPKEKMRVGSVDLSEIGFGAGLLGNLYRAISDQQVASAISESYKAGVRYFDTAPFYGYGLSEKRLGDELRNYPRSSYVLSTKVGRLLKADHTHSYSKINPGDTAPQRDGFITPMPFKPIYDYSYDGVMRSHENSLQRLGLDRIDILYVHDIGFETHGDENIKHVKDLRSGGYKALDELRSTGTVGAIGLGVNECDACIEAMTFGNWDCFLLAGRYSLLEQTALESFFPKCEEHGAKLILGGIYNSGILAKGTRSGDNVHYNYEQVPEKIIAKVAEIKNICDDYQVTLAAAALQFTLAHPLAASVIPGLSSKKRVRQTLELCSENIPDAFWQDLVTLGIIDRRAPLPQNKDR